MLALYIGSIKLSARLFRRTTLSWRHSLEFSLIVAAVVIAGRVASLSSGSALALPAALALGVLVQLALGGWFLGARARTTQGQPLGFRGGTLLAALWLGVLASFGVILMVLVSSLSRLASD